jgi:diguanylate cyclase (GGDEF)-like protein
MGRDLGHDSAVVQRTARLRLASDASDVEPPTRDETAALRDVVASSRDLAAGQRDRAAEDEQQAFLISEDGRDSIIRALVAASGVSRNQAANDRAAAASDRQLAAEDRASASADVGQARLELEQAHLDSLTGAQRRDLGRKTLQREIERSRRTNEPFALAFIDVDGLKELNDREGHAAGDTLLQAVVSALRTALRSYDPIVRLGGDEFLCGFTNTDLETARRRVEQIRAGLADGSPTASVSVGIAMLGERDTLEMLIARADADMYSRKERRRIGA